MPPIVQQLVEGGRAKAQDGTGIEELLQEQEQIAVRTLQLCASLRERCGLEAPILDWLDTGDGKPGSPKASSAEMLKRAMLPAFRSSGRRPTGQSEPGEAPSSNRTSPGMPSLTPALPMLTEQGPLGSLREPLLLGQHPAIQGRGVSLQSSDSAGERSHNALSHRRGVFPNHEALKDELKKRLDEPIDAPTEADHYYHTGFFQSVARNQWFESLAFLVIVLNIIWIGVDADYNHAQLLLDAGRPFQVVENLFCLFFVAELGVRLASFRIKGDCLTEKWFVFDVCLVLLQVWDTWVINGIYMIARPHSYDFATGTPNTQSLRLLRLLRISRVARMARLLRSLPEFMILVKGVGMALRSVFSTLCILLLVMYVFAILFTELLAGTQEGDQTGFGSVMDSMNTLLLNGIFANQESLLVQMLPVGVAYYLFLILFLVISTLTILNMLIGVMCELIGTTAEFEREALVVDQVKDSVKKILPDVGSDGDGLISEQEFISILESPEAVSVLTEVDVDVIALVDFTEYIFRGKEKISFGEFLSTIMKFRGGQRVTVKDLVDVRAFLSQEIKEAFRAIATAKVQGSWGRF